MIRSSCLAPLAALLLIASHAFALHCQQDLDHKNFQSLIYDQNDPAIVIFHGPEKPQFDNFVSKMESHGICVSYFNCDEKAHTKICQTSRLATIPTAVLYVEPPKLNPYTKKNFREAIPMTENLQEKSLEKFISKTLPHNIQFLKSVDSSSFSSTQPSVLLFTQKSTISLSYRILSFYYRESLNFFHVRVPEDEEEMDLSQFGISSFPSLGVRLSNGQFIAFTGDIKNNNEILEFLAGYGTRVGGNKKSDSADSSTASSSSETIVTSLTTAELNTIFTSSDEAAYVVAITHDATQVPKWWSDLSEKCVGAVKSALFRCGSETTESAEQLCSNLKDTDSALVILPFSLSGKKKALTNPSKYVITPDETGKIDVDTAVKRAQDSIPETTLPVLSEPEIDTLLAAAQQTQTIAVLALSGKPIPNGLLRNVALSVKGRVQFGFIGQPSQLLLERIGNPPVPSILIFIPPPNAGEQFQIMLYDSSILGPLTYNSITAFIDNAAQLRSGSSSQSESSSQSNIPKVPSVVKHVKTVEEWEALCGSQFKGLCAIAFMGAPEGVDPADTASVEKFQSAVDQLSSSSIYNFLWIDASCQVKLAEQLEVTGGATPALVVYSPLKNRFAKYVGKFAQSSLIGYLEGMAAGRVTTFPVPSTPVFEVKDCTIPVREETAEGYEADDFLAEIQREEAEKAAEIKRALEEEKKQREQEKKESEDKKKKKKKTTKKKSKSDL